MQAQQAEPLAATQQSGADGSGKSARYGNPKHPQTAAVKRALALKDVRVLGTLAHLGSVQDARLSELLSTHLNGTLRTLLVDSKEARCAMLGSCFAAMGGSHARQAVHVQAVISLANNENAPRCMHAASCICPTLHRKQVTLPACCCRVHVSTELQSAKCEIPDILSMSMCARCNVSESALARKCAANMPAEARGLVQSATHASEPPILLQLPHTQAIARLQSMKRPVPQVCAHLCST